MKAAICGDGFRVQARNDRGNYFWSVDVLAHLLGPSLRRCQCDVDVFKSFHLDDQTSGNLHRTVGRGSDLYTWAYRSQVLSSSLRDFYELSFSGYDLIVGFEMPLSLLRYCGETGIKAVDIALHPYRFLDDLILMARTADPTTDAVLRRIRHDFMSDVLVLPSSKQSISNSQEVTTQLARSASAECISVFCMQTRFDRSKFDGNGGLTDDLMLLKNSTVSPHYYKPHPAEARPELELHMIKVGAKRLPEGLSIYDLLSAAANRLEIIAVTSGVLSEASALRAKSVVSLGHLPWKVDGVSEPKSNLDGHPSDTFWPVDMRIATDAFWANIAGQSDACIGGPMPRKTNFLRMAFGQSWDYRMK